MMGRNVPTWFPRTPPERSSRARDRDRDRDRVKEGGYDPMNLDLGLWSLVFGEIDQHLTSLTREKMHEELRK